MPSKFAPAPGTKSHEVYSNVMCQIQESIKTFEFKSASASPAGRKVQARVTWTENGKMQLGYFSMLIFKGRLIHIISTGEFVSQVMRVKTRVNKLANGHWEIHNIQECVEHELSGSPEFLKSIEPLCREIEFEMAKVLQHGGHISARKKRNNQRARLVLANAFEYGLKSGLTDDEIREMLRESIVRFTMES